MQQMAGDAGDGEDESGDERDERVAQINRDLRRKATKIDLGELCGAVTQGGAASVNLDADFKDRCILSIKGNSISF